MFGSNCDDIDSCDVTYKLQKNRKRVISDESDEEGELVHLCTEKVVNSDNESFDGIDSAWNKDQRKRIQRRNELSSLSEENVEGNNSRGKRKRCNVYKENLANLKKRKLEPSDVADDSSTESDIESLTESEGDLGFVVDDSDSVENVLDTLPSMYLYFLVKVWRSNMF